MNIQLILFKLEETLYGLSTEHIIEIIPYIELKPLPETPDYVLGYFEYRDSIVPVIDATMLVHKKKSKPRLSTRIALLSFKPTQTQERIIGLMAENMTDILEAEESELHEMGVQSESAGSLGKLVKYEEKIIHLLNLEKLLPDEIQKTVFDKTGSIK